MKSQSIECLSFYIAKIFALAFLLLILSSISRIANATDLYNMLGNSSNTGSANIHLNINSSLAKELIDGKVNAVSLPLPSGKVANATTVASAKIPNAADNTNISANRELILTFDDQNYGSLKVVTVNSAIRELQLFDAETTSYYRADIDSNGRGVYRKLNEKEIQCISFPENPQSSPINLTQKIQSLTPDLSTLQALQSRPGASRVIFIDYWGGTLSGSIWNVNFNAGNNIIYTPYDTDGDTSSFSTTERYTMWLGWKEAAEDYAAFDVNVTTDINVWNSAATNQRAKNIVTTTDYFYPGAGGVAYVGSFDDGSYSNMSWTWNLSAGSLGMTIAHEVGHQVGLSHHGTTTGDEYYYGHGNWGAIMGAPFYKSYVQWSKGEYPNANRPNQDDIAIVKTYLNQPTEDAGKSLATATTLSLPVNDRRGTTLPRGTTPPSNGVIDYYKFTLNSGTDVTVKVAPYLGIENESRAANLQMSAKLQNSSGTVIASTIPTSTTLPNTNILSYTGNLAAGTYYIIIDAVSGNTNWSQGFGEYGNGGEYSISVTSTSINQPSIVTPTSGKKLKGNSEIFSWATNGVNVTNWQLYIGSSAGGKQYHDSGSLTSTQLSWVVDTLPTNGLTLYVRLWYKLNTGVWKYIDATYTADNILPSLTTPTPGSALNTNSVEFKWTPQGQSVLGWWLYIGTSQGAKNIHDSGSIPATTQSKVVSNLPNNGSQLYVRLFYKLGSAWKYTDYTYTSMGAPVITYPTPNSKLSDAGVYFDWDARGTVVTNWQLYVGNTIGGKEHFDSGALPASAQWAYASDLPVDHSLLHVTLWYKTGGVWKNVKYTYTAADSKRQRFDYGFNINSDLTDWYQDEGNWLIQSNQWLYTQASSSSAVWHKIFNNGYYENFDYKTRFYRTGDAISANTLVMTSSYSGADAPYGYHFSYSNNGSFSVWRVDSTGETPLQAWTNTTAIQTGWNELRAAKYNDQLWFFINGKFVWSGTDPNPLYIYGVGLASYFNTSAEKLWADWAKLDSLGASEAAMLQQMSISEDQQLLNIKAQQSTNNRSASGMVKSSSNNRPASGVTQ